MFRTIDSYIDENKLLKEKITKLELSMSELLHSNRMLDALEAAGVDNWEGYDEALLLYNKEKY